MDSRVPLVKFCTASVLCYWRQKRNLRLCATEVPSIGWSIADVMASDYKIAIETEIKVCKNDFRNDFKKHKHKLLTKTDSVEERGPNKFYFATPEDMTEWAEWFLNTNAPHCGLLKVETSSKEGFLCNKVSVVKRAKSLHKKEPNEWLLKCIFSRQGSQLAHLLETQAIESFREEL